VRRFLSITAAAALAATAAPAAPLAGKPGALISSKAITPGSWNVIFDDGSSRRMCLSDIEPLIQLSHAGPSCGRFVIQDEKDRATVHYTCPGNGWGRTSVVIETPRLVRISSQGIVGRTPFAFDAEARRVGECQGSRLGQPN
jgi:hypothetical protein